MSPSHNDLCLPVDHASSTATAKERGHLWECYGGPILAPQPNAEIPTEDPPFPAEGVEAALDEVAHVLFDGSHGAGVTPAEWSTPYPGVYNGYGGGLGPHNLSAAIEKIGALSQEVKSGLLCKLSKTPPAERWPLGRPDLPISHLTTTLLAGIRLIPIGDLGSGLHSEFLGGYGDKGPEPGRR